MQHGVVKCIFIVDSAVVDKMSGRKYLSEYCI
jgi:hypothetical protein